MDADKSKDLRAGIIDTLPLAVAVVPWGILTGALGVQIGLSLVQAQLMSLLVFAGAAQLSAMTMLSAGAGAPAIMGSVFMISSRHLLYSVVFREHVLELPLRWRLSIGFVLTDEMFAVSEAHTRRYGRFSPFFALISGLTFYTIWNLATLAGIVAGDALADLDSLGLDFAIMATFIAMTFNQLRQFPVLIAILVAGSTSVLVRPWLPDLYIVVAAIAGMTAAYVSDTSRRGAQHG